MLRNLVKSVIRMQNILIILEVKRQVLKIKECVYR